MALTSTWSRDVRRGLSDAERQSIDAAMHQHKQPRPGHPLVDGYEQRRQDNALRLQMKYQPWEQS